MLTCKIKKPERFAHEADLFKSKINATKDTIFGLETETP
jgi:hypothetical protein